MSIFIDKNTRVITQGITGKTGQFHTRGCRDYANGKACFVAGVNPKKAGEAFEGIPIHASVKAAKDAAKALAGKSADPKSPRELKPSVIAAIDLPGIVVDSSQAKTVGDWKQSQYSKHFIGDGYLHDDARSKGEKTLTFIPDLKKAGRY